MWLILNKLATVLFYRTIHLILINEKIFTTPGSYGNNGCRMQTR
jgi:hypothetical protein